MVGSYLSAEVQSVYTTAPADWETEPVVIGVLGIFPQSLGRGD